MIRSVTQSISIQLLLCLFAGVVFAGEKVVFYHTDPAGTPMAMTDDKGKVIWRADYRPFGEEQNIAGIVENNKQFIGKAKDKETGLSYFGARYMDTKIGRFTTADPVGPVDPWTSKTNEKLLTDPQRLNRYAYGLNNPYRFIDDSGKWPTPVHNTMIRRAFAGGNYNLSPTALAALVKGSRKADSTQYQGSAQAYMHAMRAPGQSVEEAAGLMASFIKQKVGEYKELMSQGKTDKAYEALGMAMHPLMDATSPSHEGSQVWGGIAPIIDGTTMKAIIHGKHETEAVFNSDPGYSKRAVDAIRKIYDEANR